jgi:homoserine kinase
MAAALSLHLELEVAETGEFALDSDVVLAEQDRENLCVRAFELLHPADGFHFTIRSQIPPARGLGSSAAAIVAGLAVADHLFELDADLLAHASALEGHPDNVAAALNGGFVVSDGAKVHRFEPPMGLEAVLVLPNEALDTVTARGVVPSEVPLEDAVFNIAHTAMLMLGLAGGDWELIGEGLRDRLHQPFRAELYPRSADLLERAPALGALGATISGAGPSVLVWCLYEQTGTVVQALEQEVGEWATVSRCPFESRAADVREL